MRRVPEELNRLMWLVAEEQDPRAIEEFGDRYPHLRAELSQRLEMVRGLRGAKVVGARSTIPAFSLRNGPARSGWATAGLATAACLVLALVGYAGYRSSQSAAGAVEPSRSDEPLVRPAPDQRGDGHAPHQRTPVLDEPEPTAAPTGAEAPKGSDVKVSPKLSVKLNAPSIEEALQALAKQAKVKFTIAPGMPEHEVAADFFDETLANILERLGSAHGFTALEQEEGHYLVIPARPEAPSR